eukprot:Amastigsp_a179877_34.p3 type:complete len:116 gc:universal Amastigsp_a179877_34:849-502(-)
MTGMPRSKQAPKTNSSRATIASSLRCMRPRGSPSRQSVPALYTTNCGPKSFIARSSRARSSPRYPSSRARRPLPVCMAALMAPAAKSSPGKILLLYASKMNVLSSSRKSRSWPLP